MTHRERLWLGLIVAGCLLLLAGAALPQIESDAAFYGRIARNILASGNWLTMDHPFRPEVISDKPPLTIWLMALSLRFGGLNDVSLRLWQILTTVALVPLTYRLSRLARGTREEALLAALLVVTFVQVFMLSGLPQQDVPLTFFLTLAFLAYMAYRRSGVTTPALLASVWVAMAVLTKGIVALVIFCLVVVVDLAVTWKRTDRGGHWRWGQAAAGAAVFLLVAAPWFVIGAVRQGQPFIDTFFLQGNLGIWRFFHSTLRSPVPYWMGLVAYIPMVAGGMLPWTGLLPGAVREFWRGLRGADPTLRISALWAGLLFLFLSLSAGDKVYRYLQPCYPVLAVFAARFLIGVIDDARRMRSAAAISLLIGVPLSIVAIWRLNTEYPESQVYLSLMVPFVVVLFVAVAVFGVVALAGRSRQAVAILAVGALVSYGVAYWTVGTQWYRLTPWPTVGATIDRLYRPGDRVVVRGAHGGELAFASFWVTAPAPLSFAENDEELLKAWTAGGVFGLFAPDAYARLRDRLHPTILLTMPVGWVLALNR